MNVFTFTGFLGRDCSTNNVSSTAVCNFSVAVKSGYGDKEQTIWVDCALWGKKAEGRLPEFLVKGAQVAVHGEMGTREHEGKTYITCRVAELSLIGGKQEGSQTQHQQSQQQHQGYQQPMQQAPQQQYQPSQSMNYSGNQQAQQQYQQAPQQAPGNYQQQPQPVPNGQGFGNFDDSSIPF